ncbi:MAG: crAss001_48 related protein [Holdemanella porci]
MELNETIDLMKSADYKDRFKAEYFQVKIRYDKLLVMYKKMCDGTLEFKPTCPKEFYILQLEYMNRYLDILKRRAKLENIDLIS